MLRHVPIHYRFFDNTVLRVPLHPVQNKLAALSLALYLAFAMLFGCLVIYYSNEQPVATMQTQVSATLLDGWSCSILSKHTDQQGFTVTSSAADALQLALQPAGVYATGALTWDSYGLQCSASSFSTRFTYNQAYFANYDDCVAKLESKYAPSVTDMVVTGTNAHMNGAGFSLHLAPVTDFRAEGTASWPMIEGAATGLSCSVAATASNFVHSWSTGTGTFALATMRSATASAARGVAGAAMPAPQTASA